MRGASAGGQLGLLFLLSSGCSVIMLDPPPRATPGASEPWRRECRKAPATAAGDAGIVATGGFFTLRASAPELFGGQPSSIDGIEKILGYSTMAVGAASGIYGLYVVARCRSGIPGEAPASPSPVRPAAVAGFPDAVLQYRFGESPAQAQQTCAASSGAFATADGYSSCRAASASLSTPDVRLEFRFAQLSRVTLIYPVAPGLLRRTFDRIFGQASGYYGGPRVGPAPWAATCAGDSTVECLASGEKPGRSLWTWPDGEVEIVPGLSGQNVDVELRYERYDRKNE